MIQPRCKICGCITIPSPDHRCRLCREAKAATDAGSSYGKLKALMFDRFGDVPDLPGDALRTCPICRRMFLPARKNQIYDNKLCAQRAASKKYYRKRKDEGLAGYGQEKETYHGPNPSD